MAKTKYGKYITSEPISSDFSKIYPQLTAENFHVKGEELGIDYSMGYFCIDKPFEMVHEPHTHDFDQFLAFFGGNLRDMRDFQAEVELYLGEEQEKHIINTAVVVYVPKGLIHCPLNFKRVNKPIVFMDIMCTPEYIRKPLPK